MNNYNYYDIYLINLIKRINSSEFEQGIDEINHGKKNSCWAWWAFPTDYLGNELGVPEDQKTKLDIYTFKTFINKLPKKWKKMSKTIIKQIKKGLTVKDIFPLIDHNRIKNFITFFKQQLPNYDGRNKSFVEKYIKYLDNYFDKSIFNNKKQDKIVEIPITYKKKLYLTPPKVKSAKYFKENKKKYD